MAQHVKWPFDEHLIGTSIQDALSTQGVLSTCIYLIEALSELDESLPERINSKFGRKQPPLLADLLKVEPNLLKLVQKCRQTTEEIRRTLRTKIVAFEAVVCTSYESVIWDPIFRDLPNIGFYVVSKDLTSASHRLSFFPNVVPVRVEEVPVCRAPRKEKISDRRGSVLVLSSYGTLKGESSKIASAPQKKILDQLLNHGFFSTGEIEYFSREMERPASKLLVPMDYPNKQNLTFRITGIDGREDRD